MSTAEQEPLPCPFCGKAPESMAMLDGIFWLGCDNHRCRTQPCLYAATKTHSNQALEHEAPMTDDELRELLARTSPGTAKKDWKHGLVPSTVAGICAELLDAREEIARARRQIDRMRRCESIKTVQTIARFALHEDDV